MTDARVGDWMATLNGRPFWPLDPKPREIDPFIIGIVLSRLPRFGGHTSTFYSVAQHCCLVADMLDERGESIEVVCWGLLHDAAEAYIGDIIRPLKRDLNELSRGRVDAIEDGILAVIGRRFRLPWPIPAVVYEADEIALMTEARDLMARSEPLKTWHWPPGCAPHPDPIRPMSQEDAAAAWSNRMTLCGARRLP